LNQDGAISPLPGNKDWPGIAFSASWASAGGAPFPLVPPTHEQSTDQALVQTGALTPRLIAARAGNSISLNGREFRSSGCSHIRFLSRLETACRS